MPRSGITLGIGLLALVVAGCSSGGQAAAPTTPKATLSTNANDARSQIVQMQRRGDCLEAQSAYLEMKSEPVALATDPTEEKLAKFRKEVDDVRQQMPELAREDYDTVAGAYGTLIDTLAGIDLEDPGKVQANAPKARDALKAMDVPDVKAADQRLLTYFKNCAAAGS